MFTSSWTALNALLVLSAVPPPPSGPTCENPVFYCRIADSAHSVRVCEHDQQLTYSLQSPRGLPEKTFTAQRSAAVLQRWDGENAMQGDAMSLPHGIWRYRIVAPSPRSEATAEVASSSGITVMRGDQSVRHFRCDATSVRERMHSLQPGPSSEP